MSVWLHRSGELDEELEWRTMKAVYGSSGGVEHAALTAVTHPAMSTVSE